MTELVHDLNLVSWFDAGTRRTTFRGICSCGDRSDPLSSAGLVHGWHNGHVNRFPLLTRAIVVASSLAVRHAREGRLVRARTELSDAKRLADELRRMADEPLRDAEKVALDLLGTAQREVGSR